MLLDIQKINEMHQDIVSVAPSETHILGESTICSNQIMISKRFISFQGHPEFSNAYVADLASLRRDLKVFSNELYQQVINNIDNDLDSNIIADFILLFLAGKVN
jgi:GMP synthase (glutamine-hydrolysing)